MKTVLKTVVLAIMVIATTQITHAQSSFGTGTIVPAPAGTSFYLWDNNKAFVPNQVTLTSTTDATTVLTPPNGGFVFNTATAGTAPNNVTPGYYYNSGTPASPVWVRCVAVGSQGTSGQVLTSTGSATLPVWQNPYGGNIPYAVGVTDISINSTTFTDMVGMSITFIPKHTVVFVNFSAAGYATGIGDAGTYADFRLQTIIGATTTTVAGTSTMSSDFDFDDVWGSSWSTSWNAHFTMFPITGLTIGTSTTIKIQWARGGNVPGVVVNYPVTSKNDSHRSLTIFD